MPIARKVFESSAAIFVPLTVVLELEWVRRIEAESAVTSVDTETERRARGVGRPREIDDWRPFVERVLATEPSLMTREVLRRARTDGYAGGKSAFYERLRKTETGDPSAASSLFLLLWSLNFVLSLVEKQRTSATSQRGEPWPVADQWVSNSGIVCSARQL